MPLYPWRWLIGLPALKGPDVDTSQQVGDPELLKVFANAEAAAVLVFGYRVSIRVRHRRDDHGALESDRPFSNEKPGNWPGAR